MGSLAGGLFAWLVVATAYLKIDLVSSGRYRGRLRMAAGSAASAGDGCRRLGLDAAAIISPLPSSHAVYRQITGKLALAVRHCSSGIHHSAFIVHHFLPWPIRCSSTGSVRATPPRGTS